MIRAYLARVWSALFWRSKLTEHNPKFHIWVAGHYGTRIFYDPTLRCALFAAQDEYQAHQAMKSSPGDDMKVQGDG